MKLRVLKGDFDSDFIEQIIELDRANMEAVLNEAGIEFPEAKRRLGFNRNPTFIAAESEGKIIGYLEYTRSWTDADEIYISSIQIDKKYRHSKLILRLIDKFIETVEREDFKGFETNVQRNNLPVVKLYRKIGFEFEENPRNPASWLLKADRRILSESPIRLLLDKWRKRINRD
jgi:ribosomal protein S18 acetylase RimI-like enzyme